MRHTLTAAVAVALMAALAAAPADAQRQWRFGIGGTGLFSLEEAGGTSWGGIGLIGYEPAHGLGFRADATVTSREGKASLLVTGDVVYLLETPLAVFHPYLLGGPGYSEVNSAFLVKVGGGLAYHFLERNRGPVIFGEPTLNLLFYGDGMGSAIQMNLGVKFGG